MPTDGFSKAKANSKPLQEFMATPEVSEWLEIEVRGKETERTYFSSLFRYWNEFLSKTYLTLRAWIDAVTLPRVVKVEPFGRGIKCKFKPFFRRKFGCKCMLFTYVMEPGLGGTSEIRMIDELP